MALFWMLWSFIMAVTLGEAFGLLGIVVWLLLVWLGSVACRALARYIGGDDWGASPFR